MLYTITVEGFISGVKIECVKGDITNQRGINAIVNAANAQLTRGGGVSGAIHRAAGSELEKECRRLAPIKTGEAVITPGYKLPNQYVIHCLGPRYGVDKPEAELLARCYRNALKLAEEYKLESVAFPAISTGVFGYPTEEAANVAFRTVLDVASGLKHVKKIRFVLYNDEDYEVHKKVLSSMMKTKEE